jgi:hypothetical protein
MEPKLSGTRPLDAALMYTQIGIALNQCNQHHAPLYSTANQSHGYGQEFRHDEKL